MSVIFQEQLITDLLDSTYSSLKTIVPVNHEIRKPQVLNQSLHLNFGVLIGITIDIKGKLILAGNPTIFGSIGESMFGMPLEGEMLVSFSGELGNLIAGGLSTNLVERGINTDITSPTIIEGNVTLSGYKNALQMSAVFDNGEEMDIYILID